MMPIEYESVFICLTCTCDSSNTNGVIVYTTQRDLEAHLVANPGHIALTPQSGCIKSVNVP